MVNMAINAKSKGLAINAFNNELYGFSKKSTVPTNKHNNIKNALYNNRLKPVDLYEKFVELNPAISDYIGSGHGLRLQNIDSEIASKILMYFTKKSVPCLCVHDSFIVPEVYGDELMQVMKEFYKERLGYLPVVDFK